MEFDLYFDESGDFEEISLVEEPPRKRSRQMWASQLVGIVAPAGVLERDAGTIMSAAYQIGGQEIKKTAHAKDLIRKDANAYQAIINSIVDHLLRKDWQPVRLTNSARLGYGNKTATYTNLVAEFVIRVFETLSQLHPNTRLEMNIIYASVLLGETEDGAPVFLEKTNYTARISEYLTFAAVRRGVALNAASWNIKRIWHASGLTNPVLQICDHISHASHADFKNCFDDTKTRLSSALSTFDYDLLTPDALKVLRHHLQDGAIVTAIQVCLECSRQNDLDPKLQSQLILYRLKIISQLADLGAFSRNVYLRQLVDWVKQIVLSRNLSLAGETVGWLQKYIAAPLNEFKGMPLEDINWFLFALTVQELAVNNHSGKLFGARDCVIKLEAMTSKLAGHWEYAPIMMEAFIMQAVHYNDTFAPNKAADLMNAVADYYHNLAGLMSDAFPGMFPDHVRSYDRGCALGTLLQAEMVAGLTDPARLNKARDISDEALNEFTTKEDINQQYQYRSQLETYAGNFGEARRFLALSLGSSDSRHGTIADIISAMPLVATGFPLLHWTRIGMEAARRLDVNELGEFVASAKKSQLLSNAWITQDGLSYPAHGIRRHCSVIYAASGEVDLALSVLGRLLSLPTEGSEILTVIKIAGGLEALAAIGKSRPEVVRKLINSKVPNKPGILRLCRNLREKTVCFDEIQEMVSRFEMSTITFEKSGFTEKEGIIASVRLVGL